MQRTVWILVRWGEPRDGRGSGEDAFIHSVHETREGLDEKITKIAAANPQYPLRELSRDYWRLGPDEDEGFFGNRPVYFRAIEKELRS